MLQRLPGASPEYKTNIYLLIAITRYRAFKTTETLGVLRLKLLRNNKEFDHKPP